MPDQSPAIVVHACPPGGSGLTPCCGRTPFEMTREVISRDPKLVTCGSSASASMPDQSDAVEPTPLWERLTELSKLEPGWLDGHGAAPSTAVLELAGRLVTALPHDLAPILVCPTEAGGVQLEWKDQHGGHEIEILPDLHLFLLTVEPSEEHVCKPGAGLYYCPTAGEIESDCHGGFDVCCGKPELHVPINRTAQELARLRAEVAAARRYAAELRDFASPRGVSVHYADSLLEAMDRAKEQTR